MITRQGVPPGTSRQSLNALQLDAAGEIEHVRILQPVRIDGFRADGPYKAARAH